MKTNCFKYVSAPKHVAQVRDIILGILAVELPEVQRFSLWQTRHSDGAVVVEMRSGMCPTYPGTAWVTVEFLVGDPEKIIKMRKEISYQISN